MSSSLLPRPSWLVAAVLSASIAIGADPATTVPVHRAQAATDRGSAALARGHWELAERELREAVRLAPDQPDLLLLLGIAQYQRGDMASCAATLDRARAGRVRAEARLLLYRGSAARALGDEARAEECFALLRRRHPGSAEVRRIPTVTGPVAPTQEDTTPGWWSAMALAGVVHDSHPVPPSDFIVAGASPDADPDWLWMGMAGLNVAIPDRPFQARLSVMRSDYHASDYLDSTFVSGQVSTPLRRGAATCAPRLTGERLWLGGAGFQRNWSLGASWVQDWNGTWQSEVLPVWQRRDYDAPNDGQDADVLGMDLRLQHAAGTGALRRIALVGKAENAVTTIPYYGWNEYALGLRAGWRLPWSLSLDADLRHRWRYGLQRDEITQGFRDERRWEGAVTLFRPISGPFNAELSWRVNRSSSWLESRTYIQHLVGLTFIAVL